MNMICHMLDIRKASQFVPKHQKIYFIQKAQLLVIHITTLMIQKLLNF